MVSLYFNIFVYSVTHLEISAVIYAIVFCALSPNCLSRQLPVVISICLVLYCG